MEKLSCAQAKQIDLVDYLATLGHSPHKISRDDYWFLSPFRDEKTASFKVNRKLNVWFDFGEGKGGTLIDFGIRIFNCSVKDFLDKLSSQSPPPGSSFHRPVLAVENKNSTEGKILILDSRPLSSQSLFQY